MFDLLKKLVRKAKTKKNQFFTKSFEIFGIKPYFSQNLLFILRCYNFLNFNF
jgi:hypothetical protein